MTQDPSKKPEPQADLISSTLMVDGVIASTHRDNVAALIRSLPETVRPKTAEDITDWTIAHVKKFPNLQPPEPERGIRTEKDLNRLTPEEKAKIPANIKLLIANGEEVPKPRHSDWAKYDAMTPLQKLTEGNNILAARYLEATKKKNGGGAV